jgi:outer membrane protein OmpA-like peptidoglycan-associated protein
MELERLRGERLRATISRPDGGSIITTRDRHGEIVSRVKRLPDGREFVLIDNRSPADDPRQPAAVPSLSRSSVSPRQSQRVVDLGEASVEEIRHALLAPPMQPIEQPFTLNEVLQNENVRASVPRIDLDTIAFEVGNATIGHDQRQALKQIGEALREIIARNPDEVYLIEGHTDKTGDDRDNLLLSERRAKAVAVALSEGFAIPPENLITRGFGERYPKVETERPERRNRSASLRRVTDLLHAENRQGLGAS